MVSPFFRGQSLVFLLIAVVGCETLPVAEEPVPEDRGPDPEVFAQLQAAERSCQEQLIDLRQDRDQLATSLRVQGDTLATMLSSLGRLEKSLTVERSPPPVPSCPKVEAELASKLIVGRNEQVWLEDFQISLAARIDTGAETASLDARNIEEFERDGDAWVRFDIVQPDSKELLTLEREIERVTRILQSSSDEAERRPVIDLGITIGDVRQRAEFTLSDRSHLDYQMLIGRNILRDLMIVDVGKVNVAPVKAKDKKKTKAAL